MKPVYIALGANLAKPKSQFLKALQRLEETGCHIQAVSGLWQSPSWPPGQGHPDYLNAVASVHTILLPGVLMDRLMELEAEAGRVRTERNAPRPLDLDIIDYKGQVSADSKVTLPHPRLYERGFVLFPLAQIAPDWRDPVSGRTVDDFIARLPLREVETMRYQGMFYP